MKNKRTKLNSLIMALIMIMNILIPSVASAHEIKQSTTSTVSVGIYSDKDAIYTNLEVPLKENDTAYDVLERVLGDKLDAEDGAYGKFIKGIDGVYGTNTSYWTYLINRESAPVGADQYKLKPNDEMIWHYTLDYGKDVTNTFEKFDKYIEKNTINKPTVSVGIYSDKNAIYTNLEVELQEGDTAYKVLERVLGDKLDAEDGKYGKFIKGIDGVYGTDTSYWTYLINRESAPVGADQYVLKPNDEMIWHYTLDYGKDVTNTFEKFDKYIEQNSISVGVYSSKNAVYTNLKVPLKENDTAYDVLERVLGDKLDAEDGKYGKFIKGIAGVYGTDTSYWTYFINRESAPVGADQYKLKPNDEMIWHYTLDYGKDVTNTFEKFDKYIKENSTSSVDKQPVINANDIKIKMFDSFNPLDGVTAIDKDGNDLTNNIKVVSNNVNTSKAGNYTVEYEVTDSNGLKTTKTITVIVTGVYNNIDLSSEILNTSNFILNNLKNPSYEDEWKVLALARGEVKVPTNFYETYYNNLVSTLKEKNGVLHRNKYSEYSRVIITLSALGYDPTNVGGYNLVEKLYNFDNVSKQGLNGVIYALIALDTNDFEIEGNKNSREMLIENILNSQLEDGGFSLFGNSGEEDITAMAIQALAKYKDNEDVKKSLDKAVEFLSNSQLSTGGFGTNYGETVESNAQVLIALNTLGISINDSRFIKNDNTVLDSIMAFKLESGGFKHLLSQTEADLVATEQALLALVSQYRIANNKTNLYAMTDVKNNQAPELSVPEQDDNTSTSDKNDSNDNNTQSNNPQTSDNSSILPFIIISTIALCSIIAINKRKVN